MSRAIPFLIATILFAVLRRPLFLRSSLAACARAIVLFCQALSCTVPFLSHCHISLWAFAPAVLRARSLLLLALLYPLSRSLLIQVAAVQHFCFSTSSNSIAQSFVE